MEKAAWNSPRVVPGFVSKAVTLTRKENALWHSYGDGLRMEILETASLI